jgi:hypothetical protein
VGLITYFASVLTGGFAEAAGAVHRLLCQSLEEPGSGITPSPYSLTRNRRLLTIPLLGALLSGIKHSG